MDNYTPFSQKDSKLPPVEPQEDADLDAQPSPEEKQARVEYVKSLAPVRQPKRTWLKVVIGLLILGLVVGAGGYFYSKHTARTPVKKASSAAQVEPSSTGTSSTTTHYVSNGGDLNLSFDYPANWTVAPASGGNSTDQTITLNSPLVTIVNASGASTTGKVTLLIRPRTATLDELASGQAAVAQDSVQFAYTKPTAAQYQYPYMTFIHLKGGANPTAAFEEVLLTGTKQFTKGQSIAESNVAPDPIITASFYSCATSVCTATGATPLSITNDTWLGDTVFKQTLTLIESLQIN